MSQSSPEGIVLGKGSELISFDLSINKEKVVSIKKQDTLHSNDEVLEILKKRNQHIQENFDPSKTILPIEAWFEQFKKK